MADIVLGVLVFGPLALTFILKSNAALGFLVLCAGFVLSTSVIGDLKNLLSQLNLSTTISSIGVILLAVPLVLTLLLTRGAAGRGLKFWLQLTAALCSGGLLALAVGPILSTTSQFDVTTARFWGDLQQIQSGVVGIGALISLLLIWSGGLKVHGKHK